MQKFYLIVDGNECCIRKQILLKLLESLIKHLKQSEISLIRKLWKKL